jgi:hypothetical protein
VLQEPEGLLEVQVVEAANVPRMNRTFGRADPYCRWAEAVLAGRTVLQRAQCCTAADSAAALLVMRGLAAAVLGGGAALPM